MPNPFPFVANSVLQAAQLNGIGEAGISFTPSWTGLTVGNATQNFKYQRVNKIVFVYGVITFGSTTVVTGIPFLAPPITAVAPFGDMYHGSARLNDNGTGILMGGILQTSATAFYPTYFNTGYAAAFETLSACTATAPFTWTTGDSISVQFFYEAA